MSENQTQETEWTTVDQLAAEFMQAMITGQKIAGGAGKQLALAAYMLAEEFLDALRQRPEHQPPDAAIRDASNEPEDGGEG